MLRNEIIDVLKRLYADQFQQNLPVYAVDEKNLKKFRTCEKLAKQGKSKIPPEKFRVTDENLFKEVPMDKESISSSVISLEKQKTNISGSQ